MAFLSFIRFQKSASARRWVQWIMGIIATIFIVGAFFSFGGSPGQQGRGGKEQGPAFTVNGEAMSMQQYDFLLKRQQDQMRMFGGGGSDPTSQREIKLAVLDQLSQHFAQMQDAKAMNIEVTNDDITKKREEWIQDQVASIGTGAARARALQERDQTEEEFVAELDLVASDRTQEFRDQLLLEKHEEIITADVAITDEEFEQMYLKLDLRDIVVKVDEEAAAVEDEPADEAANEPEETPEDTEGVEEISDPEDVSETSDEPVVKDVSDEPSATDTDTEGAQDPEEDEAKGHSEAEAKEIIDEVYAKATAGDDFEALAKQYSEEEFAAEQGGEMSLKRGDWHLDQLGEGFFDAVYALEDGGISEPILADDGYHIVKLIGSEEDKPDDFEDTKEDLRTQKLDQAKSRVYGEYTAALKEKAEVVVGDQQLKAYKLAEEENYTEALALLLTYVEEREAEEIEAREAAGEQADAEPIESAISGETWYEIARLNQLLDRPEDAETYYAKAIEGWDCAELHLELGKMLKDLGRTEDAVTELKAASDQAYSNQYIHYELKQLFTEVGEIALADAEQKQIDEFSGQQSGGMPMNFGM